MTANRKAEAVLRVLRSDPSCRRLLRDNDLRVLLLRLGLLVDYEGGPGREAQGRGAGTAMNRDVAFAVGRAWVRGASLTPKLLADP